MPGGVARALPDVKGRVVMDTSGLKRAEAEAKVAGANIGAGLGGASKGAKAAEQDVASLEKRMGAAGISTGKWTTLLGGGAGLNPALLGAGVAAFALVTAGKAIIEVSDQWEASQQGLNQAIRLSLTNFDQANSDINQFISSNRRYISSQAEVVDSYAALTREGLSRERVQDDLNLALDLSAIKHIKLGEATTLLQQAEMGRGRALLPLGINMKEYPVQTESATQAAKKLEAAEKAVEKATAAHTAALKAHGPHSTQAKTSAQALADANAKLAEAHNYAAERAKASAEVHDLLHQKLDGGRKSTQDLQQSMNQLGNAWQDMAKVAGPPLTKFLGYLIDQLTGLLGVISSVVGKIEDLIGWLGKLKLPNFAGVPTVGQGNPSRPAGFGRASGGAVLPNSIYTVGERGPETLFMGPGGSGGTIVPGSGPRGGGGSGGATVIVNVAGSVTTERQLHAAIREGIRRLDRAQT